MFVFVYALWCGYCKQFKPLWDKVSNEYKNKFGDDVKFVMIDSDSKNDLDMKILKKLQVDGLPTLLYVNKKQMTTFDEERTEEKLKEFFDSALKFDRENGVGL